MATMLTDYLDPDKDLSVTLTVAIALDDEQLPPTPHNVASSDHYDPAFEISAPISATEACPVPPSNILVRHLPLEARKMLCLRLNPPSYGSMKNWEYIACIVGLTSDEIANLQISPDPMNALLNHLNDQPLENLITALGQCKLIDVLLTLAKYSSSLSATPPPINLNNISSLNGDSAVYSLRSGVHIIEQPPEQFILLTYHVNKSDPHQKSLYKCFKWMQKNLIANALNGLEVININNIDNESDFYGIVDKFFRKAKHIVLFATPQYIVDITNLENKSEDRFIKMKRFLHRLMEGEYHDNGFQNYRFRVVQPDIGPDDCIPPGWPRNTVVYKFPSGSMKLFERLNKDD